MTRPTSKRAERARDWAALLQAVREEQASITDEARKLWESGRWSDPRPSWDEDYVHAIQKALEARDPAPLLAMLDAGVPVSALLLPAIAEVIRDARQGQSSGRPAALTMRQDHLIREHFNWFTTHGKMGQGMAIEHLAELNKVSTDSVKRSLKRTAPKAK